MSSMGPKNPPPSSGRSAQDSHVELPLDPDSTRPLHRQPASWAWVFLGGIVGTGLRWLIEQAMPTPPGTWPWATFVINVAGAFVLGALLEALAIAGPDIGWRRRIRLFGGTGLCGAFTTYSTLALEVSLLGHHGASMIGVAYGMGSIIAGFAAAWLGIATSARLTRAGSVS